MSQATLDPFLRTDTDLLHPSLNAVHHDNNVGAGGHSLWTASRTCFQASHAPSSGTSLQTVRGLFETELLHAAK